MHAYTNHDMIQQGQITSGILSSGAQGKSMKGQRSSGQLSRTDFLPYLHYGCHNERGQDDDNHD
jgi:hypothetical protein